MGRHPSGMTGDVARFLGREHQGQRPHSRAAKAGCLGKGEGGLRRRVIAAQGPGERCRSSHWQRSRVPPVSTIAELAEDRTVEGVYAVARKQRLRTRKGAAYLALELVDPTGRIEARVWNDVELLDGRFAEGDAVRVLGRVSRFGERLQLEVRSVETSDADPAQLAPRLRR